MYQGTTPTHTFVLPFDTSTLAKVVIIYAQNDVEVLRKETPNCVLDGQEIKTTLTQEDTFRFKHESNVQIQVRVLTVGGNALASDIFTVSVDKCLDNGVLV